VDRHSQQSEKLPSPGLRPASPAERERRVRRLAQPLPLPLAGEGWGEGTRGSTLATERSFPHPACGRPLPRSGRGECAGVRNSSLSRLRERVGVRARLDRHSQQSEEFPSPGLRSASPAKRERRVRQRAQPLPLPLAGEVGVRAGLDRHSQQSEKLPSPGLRPASPAKRERRTPDAWSEARKKRRTRRAWLSTAARRALRAQESQISKPASSNPLLKIVSSPNGSVNAPSLCALPA